MMNVGIKINKSKNLRDTMTNMETGFNTSRSIGGNSGRMTTTEDKKKSEAKTTSSKFHGGVSVIPMYNTLLQLFKLILL